MLWQRQILDSQPGIKHMTPAVEAQSLNHWTTGGSPLNNNILNNDIESHFLKVVPLRNLYFM